MSLQQQIASSTFDFGSPFVIEVVGLVVFIIDYALMNNTLSLSLSLSLSLYLSLYLSLVCWLTELSMADNSLVWWQLCNLLAARFEIGFQNSMLFFFLPFLQ